ncbi:hypothetical protein A3D81_02915 [Candidatus Curtissbacteria bacterium RIFCSPHIGHO2_02_FULL_40_17]|uniref:Uncharacterized protein n=3 Tax=Candidatus Curtissiibacteriota TaxID=1752717 RepID=A0A1F5GJV8_9BACT|nr:MAG: hypothetical protein A2693_00250 [Candidatus Curtissbacteria bacterium RIFCSPHIGHO2_01_FULL_40_12]OGD92163.1 MAG: hypothetical protein A3D81_02915 [Candidatus Curtissbacteria bacterium RIFCSPHIGHO2_02_FULL_40_17]OGE07788.1 MAG: hypothetical protein A3I53_02210 [Candidatus Curtissbacteria bacterium RIFCSPLOWO2_02_FULL_40_13b]
MKKSPISKTQQAPNALTKSNSPTTVTPQPESQESSATIFTYGIAVGSVTARLDHLEKRLDKLEDKIDKLQEKLEEHDSDLREELKNRMTSLEEDLKLIRGLSKFVNKKTGI